MAGRVTFRNPEIHNDSGWVQPCELTQRAKIKIENLIGRKLTYLEIADICKHLARIKTMRTGFKNATNQDVKRTLASFSKMTQQRATMAYRESDSITQALIDETLVCELGISEPDFTHIEGENIKQAAKIAHVKFKSSLGGRKFKGYLRTLAIYTLNLWESLGMEPCKPRHNHYYEPPATPIVLLMEELKIFIDGESIDFKDVVARLKEAEKKR